MTETTTPPSDQKEARGGLKPWQVGELPPLPVARGLGFLGILGPGAIILGATIGSGEWLLGPATFVRYGLSLLWVTTVAIFLQTVFNTELLRYTMYTGEPGLTGFMRLKPGSTFWAWLYAFFFFFQVGWPGWAGSSAGAIFYLFVGRLSGHADSSLVYWIGVGTFLVCILILLFGRRIERTLEILNWILVFFILSGLALLCLAFTSPEKWGEALAGFAGFSTRAERFIFIPQGADWFLLSAFAAYSGAGGVVNLMVSSWARDKGLGMAGQVGFIPAVIGARKVSLAHIGIRFDVTPKSLTVWKQWWRVAQMDQWLIFCVGSILGMALPAILYTSFIEPGRDIRSVAIAAELANAMSTRGIAVFAYLVALIGAWVLFKTQLDIVEGMVRSITDILWTGSKRLHKMTSGDVRYVYYTILAVIVVWGVLALRLTQPIVLLQLGANMAGLVFVVSALQILHINTTLLPVELRPPLWRRLALILMAVFYGCFFYVWLMGGILPDPAKGFLFNIPKYFSGG
ncbi:MAG TPA: Nramp family divalent metal transporter [Anaerolineales bacterium]|nr:Nramp family divalent metal transporter [Anaerolineales bacterium]